MATTLTLWMYDDGTTITSDDTKRLSHLLHKNKVVQQERILELLRLHPEGLSNQEIEQALHMRISSVTARINELRKQDPPLVFSGGVKMNVMTERLNAVWKVK